MSTRAKNKDNGRLRGSERTEIRFTSAGRRLSPSEREIVRRRLSQKLGYIDNPAFRLSWQKAMGWMGDGSGAALEISGQIDSVLRGESAAFAKLLTGRQEKQLFLRMNYARLRMKEAAQHTRVHRVGIDRAREILRWHHVESEARKHLVESNMPLVLSMAKKVRLNGVDFGDMVCEGNMALLRAVDGFDCARGFKFSTYACRAILKSFARLANKSNRYRARFPAEFDPAFEKSDWSQTQREEAAHYCTEVLVKILQRNTAELSPIETEVIVGRFAFGDDEKRKTLVQMGRQLGLTKERVRQIQKKAVAKLRDALEEKLVGG